MKLTIAEIKKMASAWNQVQEAKKKKMDPVGKADADIDNDGDVDSSDEYLHKRRKAISKAMKGKQTETEVQEAAVVTHKWYSVKHWKDGSHHFDNLDDHLRGHEDSVKHAMSGNTARKRPDHHFGIPVKAKSAIAYMDKHAKGVNESVELGESKDNVSVSYDYMGDGAGHPAKKEIHDHATKHGGSSMKITSVKHDGPGGGASEVTAKGHVKHAMKLINHHHDENYSLDHSGHKKYKKDYGIQESVELDELSKKTLGSYINKSHRNYDKQRTKQGAAYDKAARTGRDDDEDKGHEYGRKADNRTKGIKTAVNKLTKESKDHGNMNNGSPRGEGLSPSAKKELARTTPMNPATDEPMVNKKTFDAIRASGKKAPMRSNDNAAGEKNIKSSGTQVKEDMDKIHTVDIDHMGGHDANAKKHNITLKKTKATDYSHNASGKKKDLQKYLAKHYDSAEDAKEIHPEVH